VAAGTAGHERRAAAVTTNDTVAELTVAPNATVRPPGPLPRADGDPLERALPPVRGAVDARGLLRLIAGWVLCALIGAVIVLYALGPVFAQRDQHKLLSAYRGVVQQSSLESSGLFGLTLPTQPPAIGSTVGILEIGRLHLQEAVVEGVGPAQTEKGPGHVPGTAGLGQPGNAAVVGRRDALGGPFSGLSSLRAGDAIVVTTIEGQSLYVVRQVRTLRLTGASAPAAPAVSGTGAAAAPAVSGSTIRVGDLYGSTTDNRLTLVTSSSDLPWNRSEATVVMAAMKTEPFTPTPQQAQSPGEDGRSGAGGAWAPFVLALQLFAAVAIGAVVLYRRCSVRTAYLLSTAPLVVATIVLAVAGSRLLPAWT
jgi:sortase A